MISKPSLNQKKVEIKRALISVYDKTGVVDLSKKLIELGVEILSTGGTAGTLRDEGHPRNGCE